MSALPHPINPYQSPQQATDSGPRPRVFTTAAMVWGSLVVGVPWLLAIVGAPTAMTLFCAVWISQSEMVLWAAAAIGAVLAAPAVVAWQNVSEALPRGMKRRLAAWWHKRGVDVAALGGTVVELGVADGPRVYHRLATNWDIGFLFLTPERLVYLGDLAVFSIARDSVRSLRRGFSGIERHQPDCIYVEWQSGVQARPQTFSVWPSDGPTLRRSAALTDSLEVSLEQWLVGAGTASLPAEWAAPPEPEFASVPSGSGRANALTMVGVIGFNFVAAAGLLALSLSRPLLQHDVPGFGIALLGGCLLAAALGFLAIHSPSRIVAAIRGPLRGEPTREP